MHCNTDTVLARVHTYYIHVHMHDDRSNIPQINDVMGMKNTKVQSTKVNSASSMDDFLDDEIGENSKLLPDLLRGLKKKEALLEGQVNDDHCIVVLDYSLKLHQHETPDYLHAYMHTHNEAE